MKVPPVVALVVALGSAAAGCASSTGADKLSAQPRPSAPATVPATATLSPAPAASATAGRATASGGTLVTASAIPPSSPTARPTRTGSVTLTENDSGETVSLRVGDEISVVLGGSGQQWDQPTAQGDPVRRTSASGGYPTTQPARATFLAVAGGTARLEATTDAPCLHSQPRCMIAQRAWSVDVVVRR